MYFFSFSPKNCNKKNDLIYLVSNGDVGALPAILSSSYSTVLADRLVSDGNSLWQPAVLQNDLRGQRLSNRKEREIDNGHL